MKIGVEALRLPVDMYTSELIKFYLDITQGFPEIVRQILIKRTHLSILNFSQRDTYQSYIRKSTLVLFDLPLT